MVLPGMGAFSTGIFAMVCFCGFATALTDRCGARGYGGYVVESFATLVDMRPEECQEAVERRIALFAVPLNVAPWVACGTAVGFALYGKAADSAACWRGAQYYGVCGVGVTMVTHGWRRIDRQRMMESLEALLLHHDQPDVEPYPMDVYPPSMRLVRTSKEPRLILDWLDAMPSGLLGCVMVCLGGALLIFTKV